METIFNLSRSKHVKIECFYNYGIYNLDISLIRKGYFSIYQFATSAKSSSKEPVYKNVDNLALLAWAAAYGNEFVRDW